MPFPKPELFDEEKTYDEKISPLMAEIIRISKEHQIPFFASFAFRNHAEEGIGLCTTNIHFPGRQIEKLRLAAAEVTRNGDFMAMMIVGPKTPP